MRDGWTGGPTSVLTHPAAAVPLDAVDQRHLQSYTLSVMLVRNNRISAPPADVGTGSAAVELLNAAAP